MSLLPSAQSIAHYRKPRSVAGTDTGQDPSDWRKENLRIGMIPSHWEDLDYLRYQVREKYQCDTLNTRREIVRPGSYLLIPRQALGSCHALGTCVASCIITMHTPPTSVWECSTINSSIGIGLPNHNIVNLVFHLPRHRLDPP
jgi:hypothetical protein